MYYPIILSFFFGLVLSLVMYPLLIWAFRRMKIQESIREVLGEKHIAKHKTPTMGGLIFVINVTAILIFYMRGISLELILIYYLGFSFGFCGFLEDCAKSLSSSKLRGIVASEVGKIVNRNKMFKLYKFLLIPWDIFKDFARVVGSSPEPGEIISSQTKLLIHLLIAAIFTFTGYFFLDWSSISILNLYEIHLGMFYPIIFTFIIVFLVNLISIVDGIDGLFGSLSLIVLITLSLIAIYFGIDNILVLIMSLIGTVCGYLYFNWYPAKIFMGDTGSDLLAGIIIALFFIFRIEVFIILLALIMLLDGLSSISQQLSVKLFRKKLFSIAPYHHALEKRGWSELKIVFVFVLLQITFSIIGVTVFFNTY